MDESDGLGAWWEEEKRKEALVVVISASENRAMGFCDASACRIGRNHGEWSSKLEA